MTTGPAPPVSPIFLWVSETCLKNAASPACSSAVIKGALSMACDKLAHDKLARIRQTGVHSKETRTFYIIREETRRHRRCLLARRYAATRAQSTAGNLARQHRDACAGSAIL